MSVSIRTARSEDAEAIARLLTQLGYPVEGDAVPARLARLDANERAVVLLAEREDEVIGMASVHVLSLMNRPSDVAWLTALVVDETVRGTGVGRRLVHAVEEHARAAGCEWLSVTTHERRADAHEFYRRIGFELTGRRFGKDLTRPS